MVEFVRMKKRPSHQRLLNFSLWLAFSAVPFSALMVLRLAGVWRGRLMAAALLACILSGLLHRLILNDGYWIFVRFRTNGTKNGDGPDDPQASAVAATRGPKSPMPLAARLRSKMT